MPTPYDTYITGGYAPGMGPFGIGSQWSNEIMTEAQQYMPEGAAFQTAFTGLLPQAMQNYYGQLENKLIGQGNAEINRMLAERGMGVQRVGQGAQLSGLMRQNIGIARAQAELENARQIAGARYGALTRPTGRTMDIARTGWQAQTGQGIRGGGGSPIGGGGGGGEGGRGGGGGFGGRGGGAGDWWSTVGTTDYWPFGAAGGLGGFPASMTIGETEARAPYTSLSDRIRSGAATAPVGGQAPRRYSQEGTLYDFTPEGKPWSV